MKGLRKDRRKDPGRGPKGPERIRRSGEDPKGPGREPSGAGSREGTGWDCCGWFLVAAAQGVQRGEAGWAGINVADVRRPSQLQDPCGHSAEDGVAGRLGLVLGAPLDSVFVPIIQPSHIHLPR